MNDKSSPLIIAVESTASGASAAVTRGKELLGCTTLYAGSSTHSVTLLPLLDTLLTQLSLSVGDADAFAAAVGPGSFTGVRIGVSLIKGLAFGSGKPCVAVPTLEALALGVRGLGGILCPVLDARRGQVYNALFDGETDVCRRLCDDRLIPADELFAQIKAEYKGKRLLLCGDGVGAVKKAAAESGIDHSFAPDGILRQSAAAVAFRAAELIAEGSARVTDDRSFAPEYLRAPQAERERLERLKSGEEPDGKSI